MFEIVTTTAVSNATVAGLLCSALESGGIGYWCAVQDVIVPPDAVPSTTHKGWYKVDDDEYPAYIAAPILGGELILVDLEDTDNNGKPVTYKVNRKAIEMGLKLMTESYKRHFNDIITENDDVETADVFVQCSIFGEIVYA